MKWILLVAVGALAGCATQSTQANSADAFFASLQQLCGKAYEGQMVSSDAVDADMKDKRLVMHVRQCTDGQIRIPFHVGEDRSRTWVISRTAQGLRLKHDHRHEDGSADELTMYGGETAGPGTSMRQEFPVDEESIALFTRTNSSVSNTNVWALEKSASRFAYELRRPPVPGGRFFRVEFNIDHPVAPPPPPWGSR